MSDLCLAIVGLGPWGRNLLRVFSSVDRVRVVAVCDSDVERLAQGPPNRGHRRTTVFEDVLHDERIHAVVLATPPAVHADQCAAALDAGKHVFVEKPVALRSSDAARLIDRVSSSCRKLFVGHILRYHPALVRLTDLVSSGRLGRVGRMHSVRLGTGEGAEEESIWWTLAPHDVSAMRAIVQGEATSVSARFGYRLASGYRPIRATLRFSTGCRATIVVSLHAARKVRRITVVGTLATAVFDDLEPRDKIRLYPVRRADGEPGAGLGRTRPWVSVPVSVEEPLLVEARQFVSAILDGSPIATDVVEGSRVVAVLEAGHRSLRSGGTLVGVPQGARSAAEDAAILRDVRRRSLQLGAAPGPDAPPPSGGAAVGSSDEYPSRL